jgi:anti-sigma-K factor RskA
MNTANHIAPEDLPLIALQFLPEPLMSEALVHLEHCEACREEIARFQGDLATYALTSEMHSPPALARERLMRRVVKEKKVIPLEPQSARSQPVAASAHSEEPVLASRRSGMFDVETYEEPRRSRGAGFATWFGWAIAVGLAVVSGLLFYQRQRLQANVNDLTAKLSQNTGTDDRAQAVLKAITDQGAIQIAMHIPPPDGVPSPRLPQGHTIYLADKGQLVFVASDLLPVPQGKTYELWVLPQQPADAPKGQSVPPVPAGTFKPDQNGSATLIMPDIPKGITAQGFGVTIEDDGGSKTPTYPIVLVGLGL